ncbi:hypothetical protein FJT64_022901 [Amphibalanus amphitrite]|uniref:Uncharacterized protein n=1 Tax=Amphibalanus amphitrite TaxID=1232801 RepID=A0A6A4WEP5_AMPAM|nr:hypothetical protein FJT64_027024 [Amphibalanus amphitrite]KAF0305465.1 hypothetical protein FJT64_022901 [Amphibalanus amphitrite]
MHVGPTTVDTKLFVNCDHGDTTPVRGEPTLPAAPRSRLRTPPSAAAAAEPPSPLGAGKDPFSDPFFKKDKEEPFTAPDPLDGVTLPDDVRDIIDRARRRHRDFKADADRRMARF